MLRAASGGLQPERRHVSVFEYANDASTCSVTGGYVYRGSALPQLHGLYFFSDFCAGWCAASGERRGGVTDLRFWNDLAPGGGVPSFGEDGFGELYVLTTSSVYKIVPS